MTTKKPIRKSSSVITTSNTTLDIDYATTINPNLLVKYLFDVKKHLIDRAISTVARAQQSTVAKQLPPFLGAVLIKWIFLQNMKHTLSAELVPMAEIVVAGDVDFFNKKFKTSIKVRDLQGFKFAPMNAPPQHNFSVSFALIKDSHLGMIAASNGVSYPLSGIQFARLKQIYGLDVSSANFLKNVFYLLSVYNTLGGLSNNASFPLRLFSPPSKSSSSKLGTKPSKTQPQITELFGSPLNTQYNYCSPFAFEKTLFSSLGSFFDYTMPSGTYVANPPFDEIIMKQMSARLVKELSDVKKSLVVIVVLPVWDKETQEKMGYANFHMDFEAYTILKNSSYCRAGLVLDRKQFMFYDFYQNKYIPYSNSHLLVLTTHAETTYDLDALAETWKELVKKNN